MTGLHPVRGNLGEKGEEETRQGGEGESNGASGSISRPFVSSCHRSAVGLGGH